MDGQGVPTLPEAFDDLDVGITLRDPETGATLDANKRVEELYGYPIEKLRGMDVGDYTAPSTKYSQEEAMRRIRAAADGDPQVFEWRIERSTGELIWVQVRLERSSIERTPCVLAEIRDITDYKARERRLHLLNRVVRHNLRNEANLLIGYADRLKAAVDQTKLEDEVETILDIATEIGTMSDSIHQIEEIADPEATKRKATNLVDVVRQLAEKYQSKYPEAELTVDGDSSVWVTADNGLDYAIEHGIENAIVHNDRETPSVTVTVMGDPDGQQGCVQIADDGPQIPDVEIDVLDQDVTTNSTYHGSGIGLWVMQWCIDSLGGELRFEKNEPRGNVVEFRLPRTDDRPEP
ncbi:PAS domain S-box-containing protein [Natronoarchaeum philippinense]|uniref:histidine kinase n=1 Tax=Natronoarchaeum philippinense TaxID=558529 RepID=A0A285N0W8_NATPI|nr:PAS domain-containing sensor histidine kinase [Natronoarchaeum philippinense]SNZ02978.1 PAS domain S-box-containing protein [Natronoarchaeum philippinense]